VVYRIKTACDDEGQPHPNIVSESGRALSAHSSVLIVDVVGRSSFRRDPDDAWIERTIAPRRRPGARCPSPSTTSATRGPRSGRRVDRRQAALDAYHDALQSREESRTLFNLGYLSLPLRAVSDRLYWAIGRKVLALTEGVEDGGLPDQIDGLAEQLSDICFCNFSLFQSLPDSWAIEQIFPIAPIQRLDEADPPGDPRRHHLRQRRADQPVRLHRPARLQAHPRGARLPRQQPTARPREPYRLAIFLVGAYQEVLGDLHNLFGDTHAVHVSLDDEAGWSIDDVVEGDTVREVLGYVQYDADAMRRTMRRRPSAPSSGAR
jgi:arginine decarboxylase